MPKTIQLDGRTLEGGGQLLRIAIGLSALTQQPLSITDIRGNRSGGGGLKLQHLTCVQWLSRACGAPTQGAEKKSRTLQFFARDHDAASLKIVRGGWEKLETSIDIGSPGAVGLVFQAIVPYIFFAGAMHSEGEGEGEVHVTIKGGTNVSNSPSVDYIEHVLLPMLEKVGLPRIEVRVRSRGWSTGRTEMGAVTFTIRPLRRGVSLQAFQLADRGEITRIGAHVLAPRAAEKHIHRELKAALASAGLEDIPTNIHYELSGHEKRLYILLVAHTSTGFRIGRDNLFQERFSTLDYAIPQLVRRAVEELKSEIEHGGCVDEFMLDQLAVYQALAKGRSSIEMGSSERSLHARTGHWVAREMLGAEFDEGGGCEGVGWVVGQKWVRQRRGESEEDVDGLAAEVGGLDLEAST